MVVALRLRGSTFGPIADKPEQKRGGRIIIFVIILKR